MVLHLQMFYIPCVPAEGSREAIIAMSFQMQSFKGWLNMEKLPYRADIVGPLSKSQDGSIAGFMVMGVLESFTKTYPTSKLSETNEPKSQIARSFFPFLLWIHQWRCY